MLGQTYVSCDWKIESKDKFYDIRKAEVQCYVHVHVNSTLKVAKTTAR